MSHDLIILGGGPAGYRAAELAAKHGLSTVVVEQGALGGVCLNEGCVPTKTLLYSAKLYDGARNSEKYGVHAHATLDHTAVLARKDKVIRTLVAGVKAAVRGAGAQVIAGRGVILGKDEDGFKIDVNGEVVCGKKLFVATGSHTFVPNIQGVLSKSVITSTEALALPEVPESLAVVGGGVIGLELASYYCSAGARVTVVELLDHIAGENDRDLTAILQKNYEKRGVRFMLGYKVTGIDEGGVFVEKDGATEYVAADKTLISVGRRANTEGIGLENLGLEIVRGALVTDNKMRTNVEGVFAAGDVNGRSMLAHTAYREAEVALNTILGIEDEMSYDAVPSVIYTNPELASVGLTQAACEGREIKVVKLPMRFSGRYIAENEGGDGMLKVIAENGVLIGAAAVSNYSSEFIAMLAGYIQNKTPISEIKRTIFPHPTVCEVVREAAFLLDE